jgi:zinc transporter ZupT
VSSQLQSILTYLMIATGAGILGGVLASLWVPDVKARSAVQHFAAGVVIAAVASELIPEVERIWDGSRQSRRLCGRRTEYDWSQVACP